MEEKDLPDWESFQSEIESLRAGHLKDSTSPLLFRGQPNSEFRLTTTLERAGCEGMTVKEFYQLVVNRVRPVIETFTGAQWDVPDYNLEMMMTLNDTELMAKVGSGAFPSVQLYRYLIYLRHHGFPSPLLANFAGRIVEVFPDKVIIREIGNAEFFYLFDLSAE